MPSTPVMGATLARATSAPSGPTEQDPALLVRHEVIAAAQARLEATIAAREETAALLVKAEAGLAAAKEEPHRLFQRAISGVAVTDAEILAAAGAGPDAERVVAFRRRMLDEHLVPRVLAAADNLRSARDDAHRPVLKRAIELRYAAVVRADECRGVGGQVKDPVGLAAAKADFDQATSSFLGFVQSNCGLLNNSIPPKWPLPAAFEKHAWGVLGAGN